MCRKLVTCYGVVHKATPSKMLTITGSKKEACEYVENILRLAHVDDYKAWAYFNHVEQDQLKAPENWHKYAKSRILETEFSNYAIVKCKFNNAGVSLALRILNNCMPVGSSFDHEMEYETMAALAAQNMDVEFVANSIIKTSEINPNIDKEKIKILHLLKDNVILDEDVK